MKNLGLLLLILASLLTGSALSLVFSPIVSTNLPINLFSKDIPSVDDALISSKTFDLVDFVLMGIFSAVVFWGNGLLKKLITRKDIAQGYISELVILFFSLVIFLQTHFVTFSRIQTLEILLLAELFYILLLFLRKERFTVTQNFHALHFFNGLFLGFYLLLLCNHLFQLPLLSVIFPFLTLFLTLVLTTNYPRVEKILAFSPAAILLLTIFFPNNLSGLIITGFVFVIVWLLCYLKFSKTNFTKNKYLINFIYPVLLIFLLAYNPNFFIGNYDSVEEGFFLGWLQRLNLGQNLYSDAAVYHPPFLIWGMFLFSRIVGLTVYSERLFLHLIQIIGVTIYFFYIKKVLGKTWAVFLTLLLFLSFTSTLVRNNVEIRIGVGLLSLLALFKFYDQKRYLWIFGAGVGASLAIFTSLEVGIAVILATIVAINLFPIDKYHSRLFFQTNVYYLFGVVAGSILPVSILLWQNSLSPFFEQLFFYSRAFSQGYFNTPVERAISLSFFHWHIFDQFIASHAFYWLVVQFTLVGSLIYIVFKRFFQKEELVLTDKFVFATSLFGLILYRVALGRSDWYHLLFVLTIAIIVLVYFLEKLSSFHKIFIPLMIFASLFFFARPQFNSVFLEDQLFKFQTYGKVIGDYQTFNFQRGRGILVGGEINVAELHSLITAIDSQVEPDETIFVYPWMPELYFYSNRKNATSFDTPYAFFSDKYQEQMIKEIEEHGPKVVVYNSEMKFGNLQPNSLPLVNKYILDNYHGTASFGSTQILEKGESVEN